MGNNCIKCQRRHGKNDSRIFSKRNIRYIYNFEHFLGGGASGKVYQAHRFGQPNTFFAIKEIPKTCDNEQLKEVSILQELDHPNIVKLLSVYDNDDQYYICQQYLSGGDIYSKIQTSHPIQEQDIFTIMQQIFSAINHCHAREIIHRDIKPNNIIFSNKGESLQIKIIDFGLSVRLSDLYSEKQKVGSPNFVSPEVLADVPIYGYHCDMWSIGVVMYYMMAGCLPFQSEDVLKTYENIKNGFLKKKLTDHAFDRFSPQCKDILSRLLIVDHQKRVTMQQALQHPWFERRDQGHFRIDIDILNRINSYQRKTLFHTEIMKLFMQYLNPSELEYQKQNFLAINKGTNGIISFQEIKQAMENENIKFSERIQKMCYRKFISYSLFLVMTLDPHKIFTEERLQQVFNQIKSDQKDDIDGSQLQEVFDLIGTKENQMKLIVDEIHSSKRKISFSEFKNEFQN